MYKNTVTNIESSNSGFNSRLDITEDYSKRMKNIFNGEMFKAFPPKTGNKTRIPDSITYIYHCYGESN